MNTPPHLSSARQKQRKSDVCIVGNGSIAKTAALGFAQAGQSVTLLYPDGPPPAPTTPPGGWDVRVYMLNHAAQALLSSLKVWDALDADRVQPVQGMQVTGEGGRQPGSIQFDSYGARVDTLGWILEERNLSAALDMALKFANNVSIVHGRARSLDTEGEAACLGLEGGGTLGASLVVGADGAQSWVRNQCQIGIDYRSYGQRAVVATFECGLPHHGVAHQWFTREEGPIALLPLPGRLVSLVWSAPDELAEVLMGESLDQVAERLNQHSGLKLGALLPAEPRMVKALPLQFIRTHATTGRRVALVGDAAHVVHPHVGQGMNLGFGDVAELLKAVAGREPQRDCGDPRVLERYSRARGEDVLAMQIVTDGLARLFGSGLGPVRQLANVGMSLVDKLPMLKRHLISHALGKAG